MKHLGILFVLLVTFSCVSSVDTQQDNKFSIEFHNNTNKLSCYLLYWIDHDFDGYFEPAGMAGGELKAGKTNKLETRYPVGSWSVLWTGCGRDDFSAYRDINITTNISHVVSTPMGEVLK